MKDIHGNNIKIFREDMINYHPRLKDIILDKMYLFLNWTIDNDYFDEDFNKEPEIEKSFALGSLKICYPLPKEYGGHELATLENLKEITKSVYFYYNMHELTWFLNNGDISNLTPEMKNYLHKVLLIYAEHFDDPIYKQLLDKFNWND